MEFLERKIRFCRRNRRVEKLRRYSCVAFDLPRWAKEILASKMGNIEVSPKDSFEIYLIGLNGAKPKHEYIIFAKCFAEIFEKRAAAVLRKIKENRSNREDFFVSNNYFWQEFIELFTVTTPIKSRFYGYISQFINDFMIWIGVVNRKFERGLKMIRNSKILFMIMNGAKTKRKIKDVKEGDFYLDKEKSQ